MLKINFPKIINFQFFILYLREQICLIVERIKLFGNFFTKIHLPKVIRLCINFKLINEFAKENVYICIYMSNELKISYVQLNIYLL